MDLDFHSYNDNNVYEATLPPMDYNFNRDMEEESLPTVYPSSPDDDDEDEEDI